MYMRERATEEGRSKRRGAAHVQNSAARSPPAAVEYKLAVVRPKLGHRHTHTQRQVRVDHQRTHLSGRSDRVVQYLDVCCLLFTFL